MLTYLIKTTEDLAMLAVVLGFALSYAGRVPQRNRRFIVYAGFLAGAIVSIVMSYMKNATSKIDTGIWNLRYFTVSLIAFVVFFVFSFSLLQKKAPKAASIISLAAVAVLVFIGILYELPDVWAYPYVFLTSDITILSTEFLYRLVGYLLGIIIALIGTLAVWQGAKRLDARLDKTLFLVALLILELRQISVGLQIMLTKRIITNNHTLFVIARDTSNNSNWFIYLTFLAALIIPITLWVNSFRQKEPYANPAEHRKIRAKWRRTRRWAATAVITVVLSILNLTVVEAYNSREVELSPVEEAAIEDGNMVVTFEQVEDGHLHRFAYYTEGGTEIRFIVIKKPNSSAYGIGLDACDICGETGYYEKGGQVVCKLCDVVMNINTIGFKGGCNPIVIDYSIDNGRILVPIDGLLEHEKEFK